MPQIQLKWDLEEDHWIEVELFNGLKLSGKCLSMFEGKILKKILFGIRVITYHLFLRQKKTRKSDYDLFLEYL